MHLEDKINALTEPMPGWVNKEDALEAVKGAFVLAVNPDNHSRAPQDEVETVAWEVLDTVKKLLEEQAVRVAIAELRLANPGFPSDEELFREARESGGPDTPTSYADLAPQSAAANAYMAAAFDALCTIAFDEMREGLIRAGEGK